MSRTTVAVGVICLCVFGCDGAPRQSDGSVDGEDAGIGGDAGAPDAGPALPTDEPVIVIANGVNGTCSSMDLWGTVTPIIDGDQDDFSVAQGMLYLPGVGAHRVQLEYDLFGCDDMFYDETLTLIAGSRVLLAASGARGAETVAAVDLTDRWGATSTELLLVHLSSSAGTLSYQVDGAGPTQQGDMDFGDVEVVAIGPGESRVQAMNTTTFEDTVSWSGADLTASMVLCVVRDTSAGETTLECTGAGIRLP